MNPLLPCFSQVPLLAALAEDAQKRLERTAEQRQYRRRQVIHFPDQAGDFVYLLCLGRIKIARVSDQGREVTLHLLEGPQVFGETGLIEADQPYELMAETLDDSTIAVFRRTDFLSAVLASPQATLELLRLVSRRRSEAEAQVADLVFLEVPKRIAKLLLHLNPPNGKGVGRTGQPGKAKFTHQELANMIGSTRETTTLILNDFKRQGLLDFIGRKIVIRNRVGLEALLQRGGQGFGK